MKCYICGSPDFKIRKGSVRDNKDVEIRECSSCELVYLSDQSHIDNGHYENSGMFGAKIPSVEYLRRDTLSDNERRYEMLRHLISNKSVLDFGCGSGGFIQKAQNIVSTIEGVEIEERMYGDLREKNRMHLTLETVQRKFDVITAFHVIEHLKDPRGILQQLREKLINDGMLIIEVPSANDILASLYDCEEFQNFTYWSQHLYLFNQFTLKKLAMQAGFEVLSVQQYQRYTLANHIYWLSRGKIGGHKKWSFLDTPDLSSAYKNMLAINGMCDTLVAYLKRD